MSILDTRSSIVRRSRQRVLTHRSIDLNLEDVNRDEALRTHGAPRRDRTLERHRVTFEDGCRRSTGSPQERRPMRATYPGCADMAGRG